MSASIEFDKALIQKYNQSGPRYTSYPTAVQFHENFTDVDYKAAIERGNQSGRPLSLYFHIPFCDTVCFYCACNKIPTRDRSRSQPYLDRVFKEMEMQSALVDNSRVVNQLHWGGGTPTFLNNDEMTQLMTKTREYFNLHDDDAGEYSIEIDPREANRESVKLLRDLGFNRMSLGVQDFDPDVQKAVNRIQTEEETFEVLHAAREFGFHSINVDLIYGLPKQTHDSFLQTVDKIIAEKPDRISVFNYAHMPEMFPPQKRIHEIELPEPDVKLETLRDTITHLTNAGYVYIGMDHFALPDDELTKAQQNETLYRNFQGYSTHADCDLFAFGATSIGMVDNTYSQNVRGLDDYYARIDAGELPVFRGLELTQEDILRRDVITRLICHFHLDFGFIEKAYGIDFNNHFANELEALQDMQADELLTVSEKEIRITPKGRMLIRNICMVFDAYLQHSKARFSKVI